MLLVNGTIYKFLEMINGKKLVCFGAGQVLKKFIETYADLHLESKIFCIADNMSSKIGKKVQIVNRECPIISVNDLVNMENIIILITCRAVYDVYTQLGEYQQLNNVCCWAANYIHSETNQYLNQKRWYPVHYRLTKEPLIPKKIHYCWFGKNPIPKRNREWMDSWKRYCPDYEIIRWDENNYDISKNDYMYQAYKAGKWGFVPDYARLDIIYRYGGVYLDTDVELVKNIDELLYQKAFAGIDGTQYVSLGLGFGAYPGCQLIKEIRDTYQTKQFLKEDGTYDLTASPIIQKSFFRENGYINNGDYQVIKDMTVYPEKVLSAKCLWTGRIQITEHTFAIHHYDASWTSENMKREIFLNKQLFQEICKGE